MLFVMAIVCYMFIFWKWTFMAVCLTTHVFKNNKQQLLNINNIHSMCETLLGMKFHIQSVVKKV